MTGWSLTSVPVGAGGADDLASLDAAAGQGDVEDFGEVVAAGVGVDLGCSAELAHPHDQGLIEHAALLQVGDQGCEPRIDLAGVLADLFVVLLVGVPAVGADLDESDARLDEPAGEQAPLAERGPPVGVAERGGFFVEVEGSHVRRKDHPGGLAVECLVVADPVAAAGALEAGPLDPLEQAQPAAEAVGPDLGLRVFGRLLRVLDDERLDGRPRESPRRSSVRRC